MKFGRFILASLVGAIVAFMLGWVFYGMLLVDFFNENMGSATGVMRAEDEMDFAQLILGNVFWGVLFAYLLGRMEVKSFGGGLTTGAVIGLLIALSYNLISVGTTHIMNLTGALADVGVSVVMSGIMGGFVGLILGWGRK